MQGKFLTWSHALVMEKVKVNKLSKQNSKCKEAFKKRRYFTDVKILHKTEREANILHKIKEYRGD